MGALGSGYGFEVPFSRLSFSITSSSASAIVESRLAVGSSASTSTGSGSTARATATRPTASAASGPPAPPARSPQTTAAPARGVPARGPRQQHRELRVLLGGQHGQQVVGLEDKSDPRKPYFRQLLVRQVRDLTAGDPHLSPVKGGSALPAG